MAEIRYQFLAQYKDEETARYVGIMVGRILGILWEIREEQDIEKTEYVSKIIGKLLNMEDAYIWLIRIPDVKQLRNYVLINLTVSATDRVEEVIEVLLRLLGGPNIEAIWYGTNELPLLSIMRARGLA